MAVQVHHRRHPSRPADRLEQSICDLRAAIQTQDPVARARLWDKVSTRGLDLDPQGILRGTTRPRLIVIDEADITCLVCGKLYNGEVRRAPKQCALGHTLCSDCALLVSSCPQCGGDPIWGENRFAHSVAQSLLDGCETCGAVLRSAAERAAHAGDNGCPKATFSCSFCNATVPLDGALEHCRTMHSQERLILQGRGDDSMIGVSLRAFWSAGGGGTLLAAPFNRSWAIVEDDLLLCLDGMDVEAGCLLMRARSRRGGSGGGSVALYTVDISISREQSSSTGMRAATAGSSGPAGIQSALVRFAGLEFPGLRSNQCGVRLPLNISDIHQRLFGAQTAVLQIDVAVRPTTA